VQRSAKATPMQVLKLEKCQLYQFNNKQPTVDLEITCILMHLHFLNVVTLQMQDIVHGMSIILRQFIGTTTSQKVGDQI
jgi:hypothetical protein